MNRSALVSEIHHREGCIATWLRLWYQPVEDRMGRLSNAELLKLLSMDRKTLIILRKAIKYSEAPPPSIVSIL